MTNISLPLDELDTYAKEKGWHIHYGRIDYANITGLIDRESIHLFVLNQTLTPTINEFGIGRYACQVNLLLAKAGDIGEDHQAKYKTNIKGLISESQDLCSYLISCGTWRPTGWQSVSIINKLDDIVDGLQINATLTGHVT